MINVNVENEFHVPKLGFELFEYDHNIINHAKNLEKNQCMMWLTISLNEQFVENKLPNVLYVVYTDKEISSENKQITTLSIKDAIMNVLKFSRYVSESYKFYVTSYVTYIENGSTNKNNYINFMKNKLNVPFRYINEDDYIFENHQMVSDHVNIPLIRANVLYMINKDDDYKLLYQELKKYIINEGVVYENLENTNSYIEYCSVHQFKNIIIDKFSITYNLSSYIINILNSMNYPLNPFVFEFQNFYIDYINKVIYLKNENDKFMFENIKNIKILNDIHIKNIHYFDLFDCKNYEKDCFDNSLYKIINLVFDHLYHNEKIILKGDISVYNFIKRFLKKVLKNINIIFIEDHCNIFYKKIPSQKSYTILYNTDTDIFDIDLKIENFKNIPLSHKKSLSLLISSFLFNDD